jgi:hypothetical protein
LLTPTCHAVLDECAGVGETEETALHAGHGCGDPLCPYCPKTDGSPACPCPGGCGFCNVGKTPLASFTPVPLLAVSSEAFVTETSIALPPGHAGKLLRPPRT